MGIILCDFLEENEENAESNFSLKGSYYLTG